MNTAILPSSDPLAWKQADTDVHVATRAGEFAGFVEFDGTTHLVRDERGTALGAFLSLDDAMGALEQAHRVRSPRPRVSATRRRNPLRGPRRARV